MQGDVFQPQVQRDPAPDEPTGDQGGHRHLGGGDDHLGPEVQVGFFFIGRSTSRWPSSSSTDVLN